MRIYKTIVDDLPMSYAVGWLNRGGKLYGIAASEGRDRCIVFDPDQRSEPETVWTDAGGTMSISQIKGDGTFLAVQNFFKGFQAASACIVCAKPLVTGGWQVEKYLDLPYVHRFDVVEVEGKQFLLACTLCDGKEYKQDWSRPGRVWLGEMKEDGCELKTLIPGITKNHGFYRGRRNGRNVVLVSGMEGLFEIQIPERSDGEWRWERLMEKEISDAAVVDLDQDGEDEIVTIEGFHGTRVVVNKLSGGQWREVYSCPVKFGHVVWGGNMLGRNSLLIGYREENAPLILMRKKEGPDFRMEHIFIDELEGPTNISVLSEENRGRILCSCGRTQRVVIYDLTEES